MLWFKQAVAAVILIFMLFAFSACGFRPMYTPPETTGTTALMQAVEIDNIPDRNGQYLRNALIDRLYPRGAPANPPYLLRIKHLEKSITNIGIRRDATSTRGQMEIRAKMLLMDKTTGAVFLERDLHTIGAFNQLDNQFATLISEESLTDHMLDEMGDNIMTELGLYFSRSAAQP